MPRMVAVNICMICETERQYSNATMQPLLGFAGVSSPAYNTSHFNLLSSNTNALTHWPVIMQLMTTYHL